MTFEDKLLKKLINIFIDFKPTNEIYYENRVIIKEKAIYIENKINNINMDKNLINLISEEDKNHLLVEITLFLDNIIKSYENGFNIDDAYYIYKPKFDNHYVKRIIHKGFLQINHKNKLKVANQLVYNPKTHSDLLWNKIVNTISQSKNKTNNAIISPINKEEFQTKTQEIFDYVIDLVDYEKVDQLTTELIDKRLKE